MGHITSSHKEPLPTHLVDVVLMDLGDPTSNFDTQRLGVGSEPPNEGRDSE